MKIMSIKKLKILLKSWISVILFFNLLSCGKEGIPHPPLPKEKLIKEINFIQIGDEIKIEINIPETFLEGKISAYFAKTKNPQKKEMTLPPSEAVFKKKNLIFERNLKEKKITLNFLKEECRLDYNYSTFWGFIFKKEKSEEKTKIFQFLFLKNPEPPVIENVSLEEDGIVFKLKTSENCKNLLIKKEIGNGIPLIVELKKKENGLFLDDNVSHNVLYKYSFSCYKEDKLHLSIPANYEIRYKYEFKPPPPYDVILLEEKENIRIEFKRVEKAVKYKVYEKCMGEENWKFLMEIDKNFLLLEKRYCKFGVSSVNEAGIESEIIQAEGNLWR